MQTHMAFVKWVLQKYHLVQHVLHQYLRLPREASGVLVTFWTCIGTLQSLATLSLDVSWLALTPMEKSTSRPLIALNTTFLQCMLLIGEILEKWLPTTEPVEPTVYIVMRLLYTGNSAKGDKGQFYTLRVVVSYSGTALKPRYYSEARVWSKISKAWIIFASHGSEGNHQVVRQ
jgi:hypothetical protein